MGTTVHGHGLRRAVSLLALAAVLLGAGCSGDEKPTWEGGTSPSGEQGKDAAAPPPPPSSVAVTSPKAGATGVEALGAVKFTSEDLPNTEVTVTGADGRKVNGKVNTSAGTWTPATALDWGKKYTIKLNAPPPEGKVGTAESTFTVMKKPDKLVQVSSFLGDDQVVGVGMPLIVKFGRAVPEKHRAAVERRMIVTATPAQEGTWHWISATEIHFRPKSFWKAHSKVHYAVNLAAVPMGDGWYGRSDFTVDLKIGRALVMTVDNATKRMQVRENGALVKTIKVSLGKAKTPSSSGTMVVMEKKRKTVFDTMEELGPEEGYRTKIDYAQRVTYGGEFIHAAPWSEGDQGTRNVSHGCVNVSMADGAWLFGRTMMGDPLTVKGTERRIRLGNGWTDWSMSYEEYKRGSAL